MDTDSFIAYVKPKDNYVALQKILKQDLILQTMN